MPINPLITRFITACYLATNLDQDEVDQERRYARDHFDLAYNVFEEWAGGREALVDLLAHVRAVSFTLSLYPDEDASAFLRPVWDMITDEQSGLSMEWYFFQMS